MKKSYYIVVRRVFIAFSDLYKIDSLLSAVLQYIGALFYVLKDSHTTPSAPHITPLAFNPLEMSSKIHI